MEKHRGTFQYRSAEDSLQQSGALNTKLLLSVPEAAELLGVSRRTIFLLLAAGDLPKKKVRRRTVIHRDDVIRFAANLSTGQRRSQGAQ
jgi:excisionase family DNA binding protein